MTVALTLGQVITAGCAFIVNLLSSATLLPAERGVLALLLQVTYLLSVAVVLGAERPFLREVKGNFTASVRAFLCLITPGFWLAAAPLAFAVSMLVVGRTGLALAGIGMAFYVLFNAVGKGIRVSSITSSRIHLFFVYILVTQCGTIIFALVLVGLRVDSAIVWYLGYVASGALTLLFLLRRSPNHEPLDLSESDLKQIRNSGLRLLPASFGNTAMVRSDRLILPILAGASQLGVYAAVATIMEMATWPVNQWVDASLHRWARSSSHGGLPLSRVISTGFGAATLAAGLSTVLGLIAYAAILHLLPPAYAPATELILPLAAASVVYAVSRTQQGMLIADGHSGRVSFVEISGLSVALVSCFLLIPSLGALGAAYGSIIGYAFSVVTGLVVHITSRRKGSSASAPQDRRKTSEGKA